MKAMILAAGLGTRLRPLTNHTPKPLVEVGGKPLIAHHLEALSEAGISEVVVNTSHLADQIHQYLGDGSRWGLEITTVYEGEEALETGGGMLNALPVLGAEPFIAVNADALTDYPFARLPALADQLAHLVLVPNPAYRDTGDFALVDGRASTEGQELLTFSGIGVYHPQLLAGMEPGKFSITPLLKAAMQQGKVSAERYDGAWFDTGDHDRLATARAWAAAQD